MPGAVQVLGQGGLPGVDLQAAPLDGKTKLALQAAVALMALGGGVFGARPHAQSASTLWHRTRPHQGMPGGCSGVQNRSRASRLQRHARLCSAVELVLSCGHSDLHDVVLLFQTAATSTSRPSPMLWARAGGAGARGRGALAGKALYV